MDYRNVTAKNNDISMLYICYQVYTVMFYSPGSFDNCRLHNNKNSGSNDVFLSQSVCPLIGLLFMLAPFSQSLAHMLNYDIFIFDAGNSAATLYI